MQAPYFVQLERETGSDDVVAQSSMSLMREANDENDGSIAHHYTYPEPPSRSGDLAYFTCDTTPSAVSQQPAPYLGARTVLTSGPRYSPRRGDHASRHDLEQQQEIPDILIDPVLRGDVVEDTVYESVCRRTRQIRAPDNSQQPGLHTSTLNSPYNPYTEQPDAQYPVQQPPRLPQIVPPNPYTRYASQQSMHNTYPQQLLQPMQPPPLSPFPLDTPQQNMLSAQPQQLPPNPYSQEMSQHAMPPNPYTQDISQRTMRSSQPPQRAQCPPATTTTPVNPSRPWESEIPPLGRMVGQPIPIDIQVLINGIRLLAQPGGRPPLRLHLKKNDNGIIRQNFEGARGILRQYSPLREWYGDERMFDKVWWEYLAVWKKTRGLGTVSAECQA